MDKEKVTQLEAPMLAKDDKDAKKTSAFPPNLIGAIADEVSKTLVMRLPGMLIRQKKKKPNVKKTKKIEHAIFLDTSAIIDGRIFDVINLGLLSGGIVLLPGVLLELKHLADTQNTVKRERGRKGFASLETLKKSKKIKVLVLPEADEKRFGHEVDEQLIKAAKAYKGRVITCDYNLGKKANIQNVTAININELANYLKVIAVPGDSLHVQVSHQGKEPMQGVGYLDDGTMIVIEEGKEFIGKTIDVVVARVIQTSSGKILFAKNI
ncbi:MAG: TRAM domain-containing protein [Patescibacteria group bacterium]